MNLPAQPAAAGLQRESSKPKVVGRPWAKGTSGNPTGRRRGSVSLKAAIRRALTSQTADRIARQLVQAAADGNLAAIKLLLNFVGDAEPDDPLAKLLGNW